MHNLCIMFQKYGRIFVLLFSDFTKHVLIKPSFVVMHRRLLDILTYSIGRFETLIRNLQHLLLSGLQNFKSLHTQRVGFLFEQSRTERMNHVNEVPVLRPDHRMARRQLYSVLITRLCYFRFIEKLVFPSIDIENV